MDANNNRKQSKQRRTKPISLKIVRELLEKEPDTIVLELLNPNFGFCEYMRAESMHDKLVVSFTQLLYKAFQCHALKGQISKLIVQLADSKFLSKLVYQQIDEKNASGAYDVDLIRNTINICACILEANPSVWQNFEALVERLELIIKLRIKDRDLDEYFEFKLLSLKNNKEKKTRERQQTLRIVNNVDDCCEPNESITDIPIIPTLNELLSTKKPFLRKNIINGPYTSVNHYLDVHYRLLREDFLIPLREGIFEFQSVILDYKKKNPNAQAVVVSKEILKKLSNIQSLYVYMNIKLQPDFCADTGISYRLIMDNSKTKNVNWEFSKRLLYGSLVCLSNDFFVNNLIMAVICDRDVEKLKKGVISVRLEESIDVEAFGNQMVDTSQSYTLLETSAYFEAYRHVLNALSQFYNREDEFPFRAHIVDCKNGNMKPPNYLFNGYIDFTPLIQNPINKRSTDYRRFLSPVKLNSDADYQSSDEFECFEGLSSNFAATCYITDESRWPSPSQLKFDESQYDAIRLALNKQIALIQGYLSWNWKLFLAKKEDFLFLMFCSKTTGNRQNVFRRETSSATFAQQKLMVEQQCASQTANFDDLVTMAIRGPVCRWHTFCIKPICFLSYTNHALDQFLELCIKECGLDSGVVRVGGRCKTQSLEDFRMATIKEKIRRERRTDASIFHQLMDIKQEFKGLQDELNLAMNLYKMPDEGVLKLDVLCSHMQNYFDQFNDDYSLLEWLGFSFNEKTVNSISQTENRPSGIGISNLQHILEHNQNALDSPNDDTESDEDTDETNEDFEERMLDEDLEMRDKRQGRKSAKQTRTRSTTFATSYENSKSNRLFTYKDIIKIYESIESASEWKTVGKQKYANDVKQHLETITDNDGNFNDIVTYNVWMLELVDRIRLYKYWVSLYKDKCKDDIDGLQRQFNQTRNSLSEMRMQEDRVVFENSLIVAMTTTGAARYHKILNDIGPKIVIVEEAAEIFESHIASALSKHCQHLILIGDHVQLRPKPNVYKLEKDYRLDVSLFERLLNNNVDHVMLKCQHRMRPEISVLMNHFYRDRIENHESVHGRPDVMGTKTNMFFIDHAWAEESVSDGHSKSNKHEAAYLIQLCKYLLKQEYTNDQITILTTYLGQMFEIKSAMKNAKLKDIRVSTVDNYQGEECDIILLSLVRSNNNGKIGFLAIENRICVALSRARLGLFCIGNFGLLQETSHKHRTKWGDIISGLRATNSIGPGLVLSCRQHPANDVTATLPSHFDMRPEGGCTQKCDYRLNCGHTCPLFCHLYDRPHKAVKCTKSCLKLMACQHKCKRPCSHDDECFACKEKVLKRLPCGHSQMVECSNDVASVECKSACEKKLAGCGHACKKLCSKPCEPCTFEETYAINCVHKSQVKTFCYKNQWELQELCGQKCSAELKCGHLCASTCGECFAGRVHAACIHNCDRLLVCGHKCKSLCPKQCPPCQAKCQNRCSHSKCPKKCSEPCVPCREKCSYRCEHKQCRKLCNEVCDRGGCTEPCKKKLKCGHDCIGFCGEMCPKLCRVCDKDKVEEIFFGHEDDPNSRFVSLEDCGHVVESIGLSTWMENTYGTNAATNEQSSRSQNIQLPECPKCKTPIRLNLRFSKYIKSQLNAIEQVKMRYNGTAEQIENMRKQLENELQADKNSRISRNIQVELDCDGLALSDVQNLRNKLELYKDVKKIQMTKLNELTDAKHNKKWLSFEVDKIKTILIDSKVVWSFMAGQKLKYRLSADRQDQINDEIKRILDLFKCLKYKEIAEKKQFPENKIKNFVSETLNDVENLLANNCYKPIEKVVRESFEKLKKHMTGLAISDMERQVIVKAIGLNQGHWFKCPKGHFYCIGECGGAMEESKCPECGSKIGGLNHALIGDNSLAPEMDGARYAHYSDQANINNWNFDD